MCSTLSVYYPVGDTVGQRTEQPKRLSHGGKVLRSAVTGVTHNATF